MTVHDKTVACAVGGPGWWFGRGREVPLVGIRLERSRRLVGTRRGTILTLLRFGLRRVQGCCLGGDGLPRIADFDESVVEGPNVENRRILERFDLVPRQRRADRALFDAARTVRRKDGLLRPISVDVDEGTPFSCLFLDMEGRPISIGLDERGGGVLGGFENFVERSDRLERRDDVEAFPPCGFNEGGVAKGLEVDAKIDG